MLKKRLLAVTALVFVAALPLAAPAADEDIAKHKSCTQCGMDREKFNFSRMYLEFDDGSTVGTCSLHCAAVELAVNLDKSPKAIRVADHATKQLIDAEQAAWVIGGKKPGVMTKRAKWAFAGKTAAEAFVKENEGTPATFDDAVKAAYQDMYEDTKMIRERRAAKRKEAAPAK